MPLAFVAGILLMTGCAKLKNSAELLKNKIQEANSGVANVPDDSNKVNYDEELANAQAEADKTCASHIVFFEGVESGKVALVTTPKISAERGFYSVTETHPDKKGHMWTYVYALPSKNASYHVLVAVETSWNSEDMNGTALIEKFKKRDSNAKVAHFYDSGNVPQPKKAQEITKSVTSLNEYSINYTFESGNYNKGISFAPRAYGLEAQKLDANPDTNVFEREIGFVLAGKNYQVIINEKAETTVGAYIASKSAVTGISQVHVGKDSVKGKVSLVIEDTAQMVTYRNIFRQYVEKTKAEEKEAAHARQGQNLNF